MKIVGEMIKKIEYLLIWAAPIVAPLLVLIIKPFDGYHNTLTLVLLFLADVYLLFYLIYVRKKKKDECD